MLQGAQVSERAPTSTRGHRGWWASLSRPPARRRLEVRKVYSHRVVETNNFPDMVKMANSMNIFKARLDEYLPGREGGENNYYLLFVNYSNHIIQQF